MTSLLSGGVIKRRANEILCSSGELELSVTEESFEFCDKDSDSDDKDNEEELL